MQIHQLSRKAIILVISFILGAFAVTVGFALQSSHRAAALERQMANSRQHAFAELTTAMSELDADLQKAACTSSPSLLSSLCTQIFGRAMSAQMAIGELPYGNVELEQTAAFVAKAGDYAAALSKSAAVNGGCSDQERSDLRALSAAATSLSQTLLALEADIYAGTVTLEDTDAATARLSAATGEGGMLPAGSAFQSVEADFPEVPALIYDGPFSEHISARVPKLLADCPQVSCEEAKNTAAALLDLRPEIFTLAGAGEGRIPTWSFYASVDGGELSIEITRQGGMVLSLLNSRTVGEATLSAADAVTLAQTFLTEHGWSDLSPTYHMEQDGRVTVSFAARQGEILCYPDLIKVTIALDSGGIVGLESAGYLMNHAQRDLPAPATTLAQAQMVLSPSLKLLSHQLALIPTGGENEVLCYEFKCRLEDGRHYLMYVNAATGAEEKILILLENENGTLTI